MRNSLNRPETNIHVRQEWRKFQGTPVWAYSPDAYLTTVVNVIWHPPRQAITVEHAMQIYGIIVINRL